MKMMHLHRNEATPSFNVENPIREKPRPLTHSKLITIGEEGIIGDSEATTLSSSSSTNHGTVTNSYTLTLSLLHNYRGNNLL